MPDRVDPFALLRALDRHIARRSAGDPGPCCVDGSCVLCLALADSDALAGEAERAGRKERRDVG